MKIPTVQFIFDRKNQSSGIKKGQVEMRVTHNRIRKHLATGVSCLPSQWDSDHECVMNSTDAHYYNTILAEKRSRVMKIIQAMVERGVIDLNEIPQRMKQKDTDKTFVQYIYERIQARQVADITKKAYHVFFARFSAWGKMMLFSDIDEKGVRDWDEYLHSVRWKEKNRFGDEVEHSYSQASIGAMHKNLKVFINDAIVDGYVQQNPYTAKRIKIDKGGTRVEQFLTDVEVRQIEDKDMPTRNLVETKDLFLMQVYTGMSYIDLMTYDFTKLKKAEAFSVHTGRRHKTGVEFSFVLLPKAKEVLKRYKYKLPKTTNQQYNSRLKLMADAVGIDKALTTHDARRTCGYVLLNAGVSMAVVSRVLGHSSIRQTETAYARLLNETIAKEVREHVDQ